MRIIVTGGRDYNDGEAVYQVLSRYDDQDPKPTLVHGDCTGADELAAMIAGELGWAVVAYPARWDIHGGAAGPIRNRQMAADGGDLCIVFPGGDGTADMKNVAIKAGVALLLVGAAGEQTVEQPTLF